MSELEEQIKLLVATFKKYAGKDGKTDTMTKGALAELFHTNLDIVSRNDVAQLQRRAVNASLTYF